MTNERDEKFWRQNGIQAELEFHKKNKWRRSPAFYDDSIQLFEQLTLKRDSLRGKIVLDAGCGSKLRTKVFEGARLIALDPLADSFVKEIPWSDLKDAEKMYSVPLEELVDELIGYVDAIICINVIDHGFRSEEQLLNMAKYLKKGGMMYLAVDLDRVKPDTKHNPMDGDTVMRYLRKAGFKTVRYEIDTDTFDRQAKHRLLYVGKRDE